MYKYQPKVKAPGMISSSSPREGRPVGEILKEGGREGGREGESVPRRPKASNVSLPPSLLPSLPPSLAPSLTCVDAPTAGSTWHTQTRSGSTFAYEETTKRRVNKCVRE